VSEINIFQVQVFLAVMLCSSRTTSWHVEKHVALTFKWWRVLLVGLFGIWRWRQYSSSKWWKSVTLLLRITTQKTWTCIINTADTSLTSNTHIVWEECEV